MDRMNDGLNCLIFKDQKEYEEGNRNVGEMMDDRRLYVANEVCVQAIGAGDIVLTGFAIQNEPQTLRFHLRPLLKGKCLF